MATSSTSGGSGGSAFGEKAQKASFPVPCLTQLPARLEPSRADGRVVKDRDLGTEPSKATGAYLYQQDRTPLSAERLALSCGARRSAATEAPSASMSVLGCRPDLPHDGVAALVHPLGNHFTSNSLPSTSTPPNGPSFLCPALPRCTLGPICESRGDELPGSPPGAAARAHSGMW